MSCDVGKATEGLENELYVGEVTAKLENELCSFITGANDMRC